MLVRVNAITPALPASAHSIIFRLCIFAEQIRDLCRTPAGGALSLNKSCVLMTQNILKFSSDFMQPCAATPALTLT